jgi:hypothetical protein
MVLLLRNKHVLYRLRSIRCMLVRKLEPAFKAFKVFRFTLYTGKKYFLRFFLLGTLEFGEVFRSILRKIKVVYDLSNMNQLVHNLAKD